jgi:L1 cell adhesion molecule like protein
MSELQEGYALGLDLGTTYSCIGVYRNGGVEIIPNRNGERTTPSIVTIVDGNTILKGEETLEYLVKNYDSSIYAIKRFIGRDLNDNSVKEEIKFENFPFKIVPGKDGKYPLILVDKDNKKIEFTVEEISSFVIKKMVDSAEAYLGKKVSKLVITVPANFNDAQRLCTKNAAKLAGIEVLRIINEPTAAALAYGIGEKKNETDSGEEKKILVFDLGGGTFDVTILKINDGKEQNFEILSTKGDKFLGGEDFDNKLVDYFLDKFCKNMNESKEKVKKDKKAIKKLKIACENIKRILSNSLESTLSITNFYNGNDILDTIERKEFEKICQDLFDRLKIPIDDALADAKLSRNEVSEIVLVGGSSRIPKVKSFLKDYFEGVKINDTINPDETIAYGATLMAAKILIKKDDNLKGFNLMDITPLSLGLNVKNNSTDPEIKKEGHLMSVIIKRGSKIPISNTKMYETSQDNQTYINVDIYEGEKKYTKYNHRLGKLEMKGIPPKKKGEVKVEVNYFIDVNGILTVTATEKATGQTIETKIKNDMVGLTDEDIEKLRKKNEKFLAKNMANKKIDFTNLKESLKVFQNGLKEAEDEEEKYNILMNYNNTLEEFIDKFIKDIDFDNETITEKYFIYVKDLIISYSKILNIKSQITKGDTDTIIKNITKYLQVFSKLSSGYLDELLEIMKEQMPKKVFLEIVVNVMEQLNECGKKCLQEMKKFCRYHSLLYYEKSNLYYKKYIVDTKRLAVCNKQTVDKCKEQIKYSNILISQIHSGAILLCEDSLRTGELIQSTGTGFTNNRLVLQLSPKDDNEKYQIVLNNYEKILSEFSDEPTEKEAICNANIIKICHRFLGYTNYKRYCGLGERVEFIVRHLNIDREKKWYKDFLEIYQEVKDLYKTLGDSEMKDMIRKKYKKKFEEISNKFNKRKNNVDFINYALKLRPYNGYDVDIKNGKNINVDTPENLKYLLSKYHPDKYSYKEEDENSQLDYCIVEDIDAHLNKLASNL